MYGSVPRMVPSAVVVRGDVASSEQRLPGRAHRVLRQAEIEELGARCGEHHVSRLQVPMDDALPVGLFERVRDLNAKAEHWLSGSGPRTRRADSVSPSRDSMHQIVGVVLAADVVQRADVRVVQRGDRFGLACEACPEVGVGGQCRREDFHGDAAVQARVARPIHLAHAPCAEE